MGMEELKILSGLLPELEQNSTVTVGPGDDCAVLRTPTGAETELLAAVDQLARDIHYLADTAPEDAGAKLLKRNLSDIAAMGGTPLWALLTVAAGNRDATWVSSFCRGVSACAKHYQLPIVGGDLSALAADTEVSTLTILGEVPAGKAILRSGAKPGDILYVTGLIGNSFLSGHHMDFEPRLREGAFLRSRATAMLDISDGLILDARRIAGASKVDLLIHTEKVPLRQGAELPGALSDGEDYELLFTAPAGLEKSWQKDFALLTPIGEVLPGCGRVVDSNRKNLNTGKTGYEH